MAELRLRVGLVGDDEAHRVLLEKLADQSTEDLQDLDHRRVFVGDGRGQKLLRLGQRPQQDRAPSGRPRYHAQRAGTQPLGYAAVLIEAAQALARLADVVLMLADEDGVAGRPAEAARAKEVLASRQLQDVVIGVTNPIAEAWLVALLASDRPDRASALQKALGFDAGRHPEQLCRAPTNAPRHAKRALNFLLDKGKRGLKDHSADTPKASLTEPALSAAVLDPKQLMALRACGLATFYEELTRVYAPRVRAHHSPPS